MKDLTHSAGTISELYRELTTAEETSELMDIDDWGQLVRRISVPGVIHSISEEVYWYFLEVVPPKLIGGSHFAFAEGDEALRLFWRKGRRYYCRQLTWDETHRLCDATGLPRDYGYS